MVARFRETIPTVKSVIRDLKNKFQFFTEITILPFFQKLEFSRVLHGLSTDPREMGRHNWWVIKLLVPKLKFWFDPVIGLGLIPSP